MLNTLREAHRILRWGKEETTESDMARSTGSVLKQIEDMVQYLKLAETLN